MRRLSLTFVIALALAVAALIAPQLAGAGHPPIGGCPKGFHTDDAQSGDLDLNHNGIVCIKSTAGGDIQVDDVVPHSFV
jgi:hypothetical protein